jgi:predicted NBD/HSP70 family sugar kinase
VPSKILAIDIGGTKVKALARGHTKPRKMPSGKSLTPDRMVERVKMLAKGWEYEAISIGYPGLVGPNGPRSEPGNLGPGWVGFDYAAAFGIPVRILNDAAMQALGSYEGGRMLFLGLGTGIGSTLISDNVVIPLELGEVRHQNGLIFSEVLGRRGFNKLGPKKWRAILTEFVATLNGAFVVDYIVIGGGNAKKMKQLPAGTRRGHNLTAFRGGFRLWNLDSVHTHEPEGNHELAAPTEPSEWRVI